MIDLFVSVVIRTYNRRELLEKCINSVLKSDYKNYEIVIVDDNSTDDTRKFLEKYKNKENFVIAYNNKHVSTAYMYNLGIKNSKGDIIVFTDDDCIVYDNWLTELVSSFTDDIMVVGGKSYVRDSEVVYAGEGIWGCNMAFKREIFNKFSFDPWLNYSHIHDELDLINRIKKEKFKTKINSSAIVKHYVSPAIYRSKQKSGSVLNSLYHYAKFSRVINYFYCLGIYYFGDSNKKLIKLNKNPNTEIKFSKARLNKNILTILKNAKKENTSLPIKTLLFIPFKAKIRRMKEIYEFRKGTKLINK